jgi:hypothetical protein
MAQSRRRERAPASGGGGGDAHPPEAQRPVRPARRRATARIAAPVPLLEGAQGEEDEVVPSVVQPGRETKGQKKKRKQKERKERRRQVGIQVSSGQGKMMLGPLNGRLLTPKALMWTGGETVLTQEQQEQQGHGGGEEDELESESGADRKTDVKVSPMQWLGAAVSVRAGTKSCLGRGAWRGAGTG